MDLVPLWPLLTPHPGQSCLVGTRNDPAGLQHCFLGEEGEVFVVASAFKSFILNVDIVTSIFLNIFVQDCRRIKADCFLLSGIFVVGKIKGGRNSRASQGPTRQ